MIANSGTPRASSSSTISCMPGTGPVIVSPKRSLQAAISARIFGEFLAELGRGLGIGPAAVQRLVPAVEVDVLDEAQARLIVGDLPDEEGFGIPAVEDVADVEDDGGRRSRGGLALARLEAAVGLVDDVGAAPAADHAAVAMARLQGLEELRIFMAWNACLSLVDADC